VLLTYEVRGLGELVQHLYPEIHGLVVHAPQLRGQLHLVNAERDTLNIEKKAQLSYYINIKFRNLRLCFISLCVLSFPSAGYRKVASGNKGQREGELENMDLQFPYPCTAHHN